MPKLLELERLDVRYGGVRALHGISMYVNEGEIVTLLGANGAGKTSTLRAISGLVRPYAGDVRFAGASLSRVPPHSIALRGIGHVPEGRHVFARMTVRENLELGAYAVTSRTVFSARLEEALTIFPRLRERLMQRAGTLSGGEQQMLAIARALMSAPRLLLLDEPSLGLSPILVQTIFSVLHSIHARERRFCSSSKTPAKLCASRLAVTFWKTARLPAKRRPPRCWRTTRSSPPTWEVKRLLRCDCRRSVRRPSFATTR